MYVFRRLGLLQGLQWLPLNWKPHLDASPMALCRNWNLQFVAQTPDFRSGEAVLCSNVFHWCSPDFFVQPFSVEVLSSTVGRHRGRLLGEVNLHYGKTQKPNFCAHA